MVRGNDFAICEMAITPYICAKATANPDRGAGVSGAGVHTAPSWSTPRPASARRKISKAEKSAQPRLHGHDRVWARSILRTSTAVDLSKITWVLSGDEHVAEYRPPANVGDRKGKNIGDMLASGELAAAIGVDVKAPDVKPLIPNCTRGRLAALRQRGHYPIQPLVVIKDELIASMAISPPTSSMPSPAPSVTTSSASRRAGSKTNRGRRGAPAGHGDRRRAAPLRHRAERNVIDALIGHALTQGIITKPVTAEGCCGQHARSGGVISTAGFAPCRIRCQHRPHRGGEPQDARRRRCQVRTSSAEGQPGGGRSELPLIAFLMMTERPLLDHHHAAKASPRLAAAATGYAPEKTRSHGGAHGRLTNVPGASDHGRRRGRRRGGRGGAKIEQDVIIAKAALAALTPRKVGSA